jgi:hypothetical protein
MDRHYVQQVCPFFATKFSLHERSRDSPFNTYRDSAVRAVAFQGPVCNTIPPLSM